MATWDDVDRLARRLPDVTERPARMWRDLGEKAALLAAEPDVYVTTPHFDGWPVVLLRLERLDPAPLAELVADAWLARAPRRLAGQWLAEQGEGPKR